MIDYVSTLILLPESQQYRELLDQFKSLEMDTFILYDPLFNDFYSYDWIICDEATFNLSFTQLTDPELPAEVFIITKENIFNQLNDHCIKIGESHDMISSVIKWTYDRLALDIKYKSYQERVDDYYYIGQQITAEKDRNKLLNYIIDTCMKATGADAASLYLIVNEDDTERASFFSETIDDKMLKFVIAKNNTVPLSLESILLPLTAKSMAGFSAINKLILNIPDAYDLPANAPFGFDKSFDVNNNYRTESVLVVPMKDHLNRVIGVIQLINKYDSNKSHRIITFNKRDVEVIQTIAGQASIALDNSMMYSEMQTLINQYHSTIEDEVLDKKRTDEANEMLLNAVEQNPNGTLILDEDGKIEYVNKSFLTLTGLKPGTAFNETLSLINISPNSEEFKKMFQALTLKNFYRHETEIVSVEGSKHWTKISVYPIELSGRQYKKYVLIIEDITATKHLNEELNKKSMELELIKTQLDDVNERIISNKSRASQGDILESLLNDHATLKKYLSDLEASVDDSFKRDLLFNALDRVQNDCKAKLLLLDGDSESSDKA